MRSSLKDFITLAVLCVLIPSISFSQIQKIFLNPKSIGSGKQSSFVDSIRFIPLEIRDDIKIENYTNLQISDKYLILVDYSAKFVLVYGKDGHFIQKINYKKLGEGFYPGYRQDINELVFFGNNRNYSLTPKDFVKIRLDWSNPKNKKYFKKYHVNLNDTAFDLEKEEPDENDIVQAYPFYGKYYWQGRINTSPLYDEGKEYELKIYRDKKLVKSYFPYDRVHEPKFLFAEEGTNFTRTDTPYIHIVTRPYCDTIYRMIRDSLSPGYQLVMPMENSLPRTFFTTPFKSRTDRENFKRNNGWVFRQVQTFYETPQFYYFIVGYQSNYESYVYQKQGNATIKAKRIKADSSQYNLQLLADLNVARNNDKFYKVQRARDLTGFFEEHPTVPVPKELQEFLKLNPHAEAPVIVEFKLKTTP